ncbi:MAG TPA: hypothetical protein PLD25_27045 [Chloroflexota bacterium]|nr:hypothetical protein [Chloroflexota bacterium]HUM67458.1 hypothetical protein [Chloroflexota bacterium]
MMTELLTLNQPAIEAVNRVTRLLAQTGLEVWRSFDLRAALAADTPCTCPHHAGNCDCDMVVLLVYGEERRPATVVAHSHNGRTWLSLADGPEERPSPNLSHRIMAALAP